MGLSNSPYLLPSFYFLTLKSKWTAGRWQMWTLQLSYWSQDRADAQKTFWRQTVFQRRERERGCFRFWIGLHCASENSVVFRFPMGCDGEWESQGCRWETKPQVCFAQLLMLPAEGAQLKGWREAESHIQNCASPDLPASGASAFPILTHTPCGLYMALQEMDFGISLG